MTKELYVLLKKKGNIQQLYEKYFALVPLKAMEFFPGIPFQLSVLLATKLCDKLIAFSKRGTTESEPCTEATLSAKEIAVLQYLGGYVLFSLNSHIQKTKSKQNIHFQQITSLSFAAKQSMEARTS